MRWDLVISYYNSQTNMLCGFVNINTEHLKQHKYQVYYAKRCYESIVQIKSTKVK